MFEINGGILEGGGQILRIALSLSCLLQHPVRVYNIRAGRPKPGLSAQHLKGIELLRNICDANVTGNLIGSTEIHFNPNKIKGGSYYIDIETAGSIALLMQVALPVTVFSNSKTILDLKGGTNAAMAPQVDFLTEIFRPNMEKFGPSFDFELIKRGYFPKGGGHCKITVNPIHHINSFINIDFGFVKKYFGWSFVSGSLPIKLAGEITEGAKEIIRNLPSGNNIDIETYKENSEVATTNCSGIILVAETSTGCILGGSALGNRQERGIETGRKAAKEIEQSILQKCCVDLYVQDQLIIYMALASGNSKIKTVPLTLHTKTAIHVIELMTKAKFNVHQIENGKSCIIECNGIGLINNTMS